MRIKCKKCEGKGQTTSGRKCDDCAQTGSIVVDEIVRILPQRPNQFYLCVMGSYGPARPLKSLDSTSLLKRLEHLSRLYPIQHASLSSEELNVSATASKSRPPWHDFTVVRVGTDSFIIKGERSWGSGAEDVGHWDAGENDKP